MNPKARVAIILVVLGIVVLTYSGINLTTPGQPIDFRGMRLAATQNHSSRRSLERSRSSAESCCWLSNPGEPEYPVKP